MSIYSIYRIDVDDKCYIGRTKDYTSRMCGHYSDYERTKNITRKLHKAIFEKGWKYVSSCEIARYKFTNNSDANIIEMLWMYRCNSELNM